MPSNPQMQWQNINDFRPGIWSNTLYQGGTGVPAPIGAATEANTYRCIALPGGGLGPAPRAIETYNLALPNTGNGNTYRVSGFRVSGRISANTGGTDGQNPFEFHVGLEYDHDPGGGFEHRFRWRRHRIYSSSSPATVDTLHSINGFYGGAGAGQFSTRFTHFVSSRMHPSNESEPGVPIIAAAWWGEKGDSSNQFIGIWPNPASPATTGIQVLTTAFTPDLLVAHQDRIVIFHRVNYSRGADSTTHTSMNLQYTNANRNTLSTAAANSLTFLSEAEGGLADAASMSASELLLITPEAGGATLNGDLDQPTVFSLPNLAPVHNATGRVRGTHSPLGYLYYTQHGGVHAWAGGDTTESISPQMEPDFITNGMPSANLNQGPFVGQSYRFYDWVLWPNNWVLDPATRSWWRIEDPAVHTITYWSGGTNNRAYGCIYEVDENNPTAVHMYRRQSPARSWSWESHPIFTSNPNRVINVREIVCVMQGKNQTVTCTVTGTNGATQTKTATLASENAPTLIRFGTFKVRAENVKVRIQADGTANSNSAAILYEIRVGYSDRMHTPHDG